MCGFPCAGSDEIWSVGFCGERKTGEPGAGQDQKQTQPRFGTGLEYEVNSVWCEENALNTAPFVLPLLTHLSSGCSCWTSIEYPSQRSRVQNMHCVPRLFVPCLSY